MRKVPRNVKGFALVELLIVVVVLAVIGGTGYYAYHRTHTTKKASNGTSTSHQSSNQVSKNNQTTSPDPYAGWASGSLKREGLMFKYPSSWTLADNSQTAGVCAPHAQNCPDRSMDSVSLTAPSGLVVNISAGEDPANLKPRLEGQGCPAPQDTCTQYTKMSVTLNGKSLYMVVWGYKEYNVAENLYLGLTRYPNCILDCIDGLGAAQKLSGDISVNATYPDRNDATYTAFASDASVKDAELVVKSLHY